MQPVVTCRNVKFLEVKKFLALANENKDKYQRWEIYPNNQPTSMYNK